MKTMLSITINPKGYPCTFMYKASEDPELDFQKVGASYLDLTAAWGKVKVTALGKVYPNISDFMGLVVGEYGALTAIQSKLTKMGWTVEGPKQSG